MRAIKIDVVKKEVYDVEIDSSIKSIYGHLGVECFCQVGKRFPNGDMLLVDDNGLIIDSPIGAFEIGQYPQVLSGHGLFIGTDGIGETANAQSDLEFIKTIVRFSETSKIARAEN